MRQGQKTGAARRLRREATDAERLLWHRLRNRTLSGLKFRRQVPVGPYVVDFLCIEYRLVVEADGGQHAEPGMDASRDAFLRSKGFRVLRFWNNDILMRLDVVCETILLAAYRPPLFLPPCPGEGAEPEG
ncbi:endonuclease domain-containing protein [Pseudoxanthomonas putridarboris]|uniref:Endonuclease domain-containing protein n=1 Tax=Pseudoxanthomonas putridarboris TaxID=752605 RepID=A0ABU9J405_9GAMM